MNGKTRLAGPLCLFSLACLLTSCNREQIRTLKSPVQAVTTLLQAADGTVRAELILISTAKRRHAFIGTAENVRLRMPGGEAVSLSQTEPGHYRSDSRQNPALIYEPGSTYQFRFDLPDTPAVASGPEGGSKTYLAVTKTPVEPVAFSWSKKPAFAGDTARLEWKPRSRGAIVVVRNPQGEVCFSTFDFSDPQFSGDKWGRLGTNGSLVLGVDVFREPGQYRVLKCGVTRNSALDPELSADLGFLSGFLAGTCEPLEILDIPE